ncbi:hypothetical protein LINPERPRIM_LOCUS11277 [Linum perenne]
MAKSSKRVETEEMDKALEEEMDKALEEEYEALCQDEGVDMTILTPNKQDETEFRLGPYFINSLGPHLQHLNKYPLGGGIVLFKTIPPSSFFQPNLKNQKPITSWPLNDSDFNKWYMRLAADKGTTKLWSKAGISRLFALSARISEPDIQLFKAIFSKPTGSGPLWLVPLWVYAYFPKLWNDPLKIANPSSYGIYFSKVVPSGKIFSHYFKFFYCMTKVEDFAPFRSRLYGPTSFTNKFTQRPSIGDPRAPAYRRWQRKTMEGISFVCFTPKARSLPSFVLRFQEAFHSNNIFDEDAIPIARRLLNGETAKTGATEGNKGSSGTNAEDTDEPQSSHASSAKRLTETMVGNPPQPAKRPRNHPSSSTLQNHEQSRQSDGYIHNLSDDQLDDNEILPSDAEETHVATDNEGHSTSSNDTSHETDSPHGNTTLDGSDTEDDAEASNFPPELTEPLPSIQLGFQQYASKTSLDFNTACGVASSVPTKNLVSQGQDPFSLSLAPTFLGDHDGFPHSQPMSPLLDAARGDYHPTNPDPTPRPDDVLSSLNNMATQAN